MIDELQNRLIESSDWKLIVLSLPLFIVAICRMISRHSIYSYFEYFRVARYKSDIDQRNLLPYAFAGTFTFLTVCSFLVFTAIANRVFQQQNLSSFLITATIFSAAWLSKHYISKLYFSILGRFEASRRIVFYLRFHRFFGAILLWLLTYILFLAFKINDEVALYLLIGYLIIHVIVHLRVWYRCRKTIFSMSIPFSLYLCALEILPYLLLYKYFTV
jgi:hypothetical protein